MNFLKPRAPSSLLGLLGFLWLSLLNLLEFGPLVVSRIISSIMVVQILGVLILLGCLLQLLSCHLQRLVVLLHTFLLRGFLELLCTMIKQVQLRVISDYMDYLQARLMDLTSKDSTC